MTGDHERRTTIDHATIRQWVERRGGEPAAVAADAPTEPGVLRIRFPDERASGDGTDEPAETDGRAGDRHVETIDWETFFERFEARELALVYRETDDESADPWYEFEDRVFVGEF